MSLLLNRPSEFSELIGQNAIKKIFESDTKGNFKIPGFIILSGPSGSGKTTVARIIAKKLKGTLIELNASDKNGVDDMRQIIEDSKNRTVDFSNKIYLLDEAHQLTNQAQNALLKVTEDIPKGVYFIFCTTNDAKIIVALKRRAFLLNTTTLSKKEIHTLVSKYVLVETNKKGLEEFVDVLYENDVNTAGLVLQATDKYILGLEPIKCIFNISESIGDTRKICAVVASGDWSTLCTLLTEIKKDDVVMLRLCICGYLKTIMLRDKSKSMAIAKCIKMLYENDLYEVPVFLANLCIVCSILGKKE